MRSHYQFHLWFLEHGSNDWKCRQDNVYFFIGSYVGYYALNSFQTFFEDLPSYYRTTTYQELSYHLVCRFWNAYQFEECGRTPAEVFCHRFDLTTYVHSSFIIFTVRVDWVRSVLTLWNSYLNGRSYYFYFSFNDDDSLNMSSSVCCFLPQVFYNTHVLGRVKHQVNHSTCYCLPTFGSREPVLWWVVWCCVSCQNVFTPGIPRVTTLDKVCPYFFVLVETSGNDFFVCFGNAFLLVRYFAWIQKVSLLLNVRGSLGIERKTLPCFPRSKKDLEEKNSAFYTNLFFYLFLVILHGMTLPFVLGLLPLWAKDA